MDLFWGGWHEMGIGWKRRSIQILGTRSRSCTIWLTVYTVKCSGCLIALSFLWYPVNEWLKVAMAGPFSLANHCSAVCLPIESWGPPALGQVLALCAHCVHTAHAEAGILTQEYPSPV